MTRAHLRRADVTDASAVAGVHRVSRADYYGVAPAVDDDREAMWSQLLVQPGRVTWVAEESGQTLGFASVHHRADPTSQLELTAMYVLPAHYGCGIGSLLHDAFEEERTDVEPGALEVWAANARAVAFYVRRGWVPTSQTRPGPQDVDFVTYHLPAGR